MEGDEEIIAECVNDPACTPADAALKLRKAEAKAQSRHLAALEEDEEGTPAPRTPASKAGKEEATVESMADFILGKKKETASAKAPPSTARVAR